MFGRGFEAFGKPVPIRGTGPRMGSAAPPPPPPPPVPVEAEQQASPSLQAVEQPQQPRNVPPGRIQVFKKGDPNAPPCPICR